MRFPAMSGVMCRLSVELFSYSLKHVPPVAPGGHSLLHIDSHKPDRSVGLKLTDQVHIGRDNRAEGEVPSARDRIPVQDNWLCTARNLYGPVGVAAVYDVGRIRTGSEGLLAFHELERLAPPLKR